MLTQAMVFSSFSLPLLWALAVVVLLLVGAPVDRYAAPFH